MTLSQALSEGLQVTAIGVIIVFSVLLILMVVMMLMKTIFYRPEDGNTPKKAEAPVTGAPVVSTPDEGELIAVLTAAIAASLNTSTYRLNIKSYRRIENNAPAWNRAGLRDVIDSRF